MEDIVYTSNDPDGDQALLFELKIDFDHDEYMDAVGADISALINPWSQGTSYDSLDIIFYGNSQFQRRGMFYQALQDIVSSQNSPDTWFDADGNQINGVIWKTLYPWKDGDYIDIHPYKWFADGDSWIMDFSVWGRETSLTASDLETISVVPNPYFVESDYNEPPGEHRLHFTRLPNVCALNIYTVSGELVYSEDYDGTYRGDIFWDMKNSQGQLIAPGLYIYTVESGGAKHIGKFAVVR